MEEPQTSARKLWSQPWGSRALLSLVCFSVLRNHQWQMPKGPQGQRTREGVGRRCHPEPEGLGAHLSFPELPLHDTAIARQEIVPGLAEGAARHDFQERQSWGYSGSVMLCLGCGGELRRALDCNHTGEGGVSPGQEGAQPRFS